MTTRAPDGATAPAAALEASGEAPRALAPAATRAASTHRSCAVTAVTDHSANTTTTARAGNATAISAVTMPSFEELTRLRIATQNVIVSARLMMSLSRLTTVSLVRSL